MKLSDFKLSEEDLNALAEVPPIHLVIDVSYAFALIGALQLACRHPGFVRGQDNAREIVDEIVQELEKAIGVTPRIQQLLATGHNPKSDVA